ncbi:MAG: hypothetical protein WAU96_10570 [Anaerolineae bacterium]
MKVKIIRSTFVDGELAEAGKTIEVSDADGKQLISSKKAIDGNEGKVERAVGKPQSKD